MGISQVTLALLLVYSFCCPIKLLGEYDCLVPETGSVKSHSWRSALYRELLAKEGGD